MRWMLVLVTVMVAGCAARSDYRPVALCSTLEIANKEPCPEREKREIGWRDLN